MYLPCFNMATMLIEEKILVEIGDMKYINITKDKKMKQTKKENMHAHVVYNDDII